MKNPMQLKAIIKNLAKEKHISAQLVMQNFMLERLLERISLSNFSDNFILKGGFLIAAMVGLDTRATMDMDATIKGMPVNEKNIYNAFEEICNIDVEDDISFTIRGITEIREGDKYTGYRVALTGNFEPLAVPLKVDITTGDKITPKEIQYNFKLLFDERNISILAYNLETILSEKLETVISRSDLNTRPRDYYDIYILLKLQQANINIALLSSALYITSQKRGSKQIIENYLEIIDIVKNSEVMQKHWTNYQKDFEYAKDITFTDTCNAIVDIMDQIISFNLANSKTDGEDECLLTLAEERMKNIDKDNLISAQEVFDELGITEEDLNAIDETEIEFE